VSGTIIGKDFKSLAASTPHTGTPDGCRWKAPVGIN